MAITTLFESLIMDSMNALSSASPMVLIEPVSPASTSALVKANYLY